MCVGMCVCVLFKFIKVLSENGHLMETHRGRFFGLDKAMRLHELPLRVINFPLSWMMSQPFPIGLSSNKPWNEIYDGG